MKRLTLVRHSIAQEPEEATNDFTRKLTPYGKQLAENIAKKIDTKWLADAIFLSSPALRAHETATIFATVHQLPPNRLILHEFLYSCFKEQSFFYFLDEIAEKYNNVWVFGHNPMLSNLLSILQNSISLFMPKCAVAMVETSSLRWLDLSHQNTKLIQFINPKKYK